MGSAFEPPGASQRYSPWLRLDQNEGTNGVESLDVLNALNDTAEEGLARDNLFSPNFGQPTVFVDPHPRDVECAAESRAIAAERGKTLIIDASASTDCCPICTCRAPPCRSSTGL